MRSAAVSEGIAALAQLAGRLGGMAATAPAVGQPAP
jgi:hypothetical protein